MKRTNGKIRELTYAAAIREAFDITMRKDPSVFLIGEGIPDPKGAFGTTTGLRDKYGTQRVMDMPVSENGLTGVCIGAALGGLRPVLTHMRIDFSLLSMDQIVNNAAKWFYMYGGKVSVPLVIRMLIGRGWGQGPQHSQSLQALFAHIPGLKVVMPATAADAKGMLISSIVDNNPVIFIEHRWLHNITGPVPTGYYETPLNLARVAQVGRDITLVSSSYMSVEGVKAVPLLKDAGIQLEIVDLRSIKPLDIKTIVSSVKKTGRLIVADTGHASFGVSSEVISRVAEAGVMLKSSPKRVALPDVPTPTSWKLAEQYYPTYIDIARLVMEMMGVKQKILSSILSTFQKDTTIRSDVPDPSFTGPF